MEGISKINKEVNKAPEDDFEVLEGDLEEQERLLEIENEILTKLDILAPEDSDVDLYKQEVLSELNEDVKKIQIANGVLIEGREKNLEQIKEFLGSRIREIVNKSTLKTKEENRSDKGLVRRARLALLLEDETYPSLAEGLSEKDPKNWDRDDIKYIISRGGERNFTEKDIRNLLNSRFQEKVLRGWDHNEQNKYEEKVPAVMVKLLTERPHASIGILSSVLENHSTEKLDKETLEKIISIDRGELLVEALRHPEKFDFDIYEKIIESGNLDFGDVLIEILDTDFDEEKKIELADLLFKNNIPYNLNNIYNSAESEKKDLLKPFINNISQLDGVDDFIESGNVSYLISTYELKKSLKEYSEENYEKFSNSIKKYEQEHLVLEILNDEDQAEFANKLIKNGEPYKLIKYLKDFPDHAIDSDVYKRLEDSGFGKNLHEGFGKFKNLSDQTASGLIEDGEINIVYNDFDSFNLSQEFLNDPKIKEKVLGLFRERIIYGDIVQSRKIFEKFKISFDEVKNILSTNANEYLGFLSDFRRFVEVVENFPEIKEIINTKEVRETLEEKTENIIKIKPATKGESIKFINRVIQTGLLSEEFLNRKNTADHLSFKAFKEVFELDPKNDEYFKNLYERYDTVRELSEKVSISGEIFNMDIVKEIENFPIKSVDLRPHFVHRILSSENQEKTLAELFDFQERVFDMEGEFVDPFDMRVKYANIAIETIHPGETLDKIKILHKEILSMDSVDKTEKVFSSYVQMYLDESDPEKRKEFVKKLESDVEVLASNESIEVNKSQEYYSLALEQVYPKRDYDTYKNLDSYEDRSSDLEKYSFDREGYEMKLSGVTGYKIKEGKEINIEVLEDFSKRIDTIKNLSKEENLDNFLV